MGKIYYEILTELGYEFIHIIEKDKFKVESKKNLKSNKVKIFSSFNASIKKENYFITVLSTTTDKKFEYIKKIASKKIKYLYVEKPIASSIIECAQIKKIQKKYKLKIGINHQSRFTSEIENILKIVSAYKNDKLRGISLIAGNIGLAMNGVHIIEIFNFLTKHKIDRVNANFEKKLVSNPRGKKFKDFAGQIFCKNRNNDILTINTSKDLGHGFNLFFNYKNGFIFLDYLNGNLYFNFRKKNFYNKKTNFYGLPSTIKKKKIKVSSIKEGTKKNLKLFLKNKSICNLNEGTNALKVLSAAYTSSLGSGKTIFLKKFKSKRFFQWA